MPGWNMITVPIDAGTDPDVVFAGLPLDSWLLYSWDPIHYQYLDADRTTITIGQGLWLKVSEATTLTLVGLPNEADTTTLSLASGWNMIGVPYEDTIPWDAVQVSKGGNTPVSLQQAIDSDWILDTFFHWSGVEYSPLTAGDSFLPLLGYWVKANVEGVRLILPKP